MTDSIDLGADRRNIGDLVSGSRQVNVPSLRYLRFSMICPPNAYTRWPDRFLATGRAATRLLCVNGVALVIRFGL